MKTDEVTRIKARLRRKRLREQGLCITASSHGPATNGVLCETCRARHRGRPVASAQG